MTGGRVVILTSRIFDADGAVVTFGNVFNTTCIESHKIDLPANARTSPEGKKGGVYTQPPAGLANSPQTVPNRSFSPQNVGAGLNTAVTNLS